MEYLVALVLWGVFSWYQLMRPTRGHTETDEPAQFEPVDDTDELINRLDKELRGEEA